MFLTSDLCYVEMHRSGSTHLVKLFEKYMPDGKKIGVHNRPDQEIYDSNRFFVGSIRNPWEWYVSLWSFGCVNKGTLYGRLTSKKVYLRNLGWRTKPILSSYIFFQQLWKPLDMIKPYKKAIYIGKKSSHNLYKNSLSLPSSANLKKDEQDFVIDLIIKLLKTRK